MNFIFHFIYGMSSETHWLSLHHFSRWFLNHQAASVCTGKKKHKKIYLLLITHDGSGWCWYINANMTGVYGWDPWHTIYSSTMDPSTHHINYQGTSDMVQQWFTHRIQRSTSCDSGLTKTSKTSKSFKRPTEVAYRWCFALPNKGEKVPSNFGGSCFFPGI